MHGIGELSHPAQPYGPGSVGFRVRLIPSDAQLVCLHNAGTISKVVGEIDGLQRINLF
ncbi:hypothetical protein P175DRAFT_0497011 [Aspergillus ochraceoroseus IBT 24754]|uniref:Uncharacterized protein n=1 Tax=Aspergillus ochraceoroseus IBT 24754 TaxID=1392256 RepID=A0A2T5M5T7_9EURO|nr:uncharacterized protein P175DRAFT_0497011 [Aspergillus ochraceoroseus IBT 24754]PTU23891.1 hypothetical protein P175DRAFT_0497011 [Aspergillus ochraceoroseus IBT 24754]